MSSTKGEEENKCDQHFLVTAFNLQKPSLFGQSVVKCLLESTPKIALTEK